jgi:ATPase subunit of ABC transporter with duplicated ATPase domains
MQKRFVIKINKIKKYFSEKLILDNVSFSLYFGEKVGFVGANGSGKSTLVKIISGLEKKNEGEIEIFKNFKISYLPQEFGQNISVSEYLNFSEKDKSKVLKSLKKFDFEEEILLRKISSLSGGEKTKIFLTKVSLENSQIIILDEPTNNLDSEGLEILEKIIKNSDSAFLIISHDRNFLNNTVSKIIELNEFSHKIKIYDGNYSDYRIEKENFEKKQDQLFVENQRQKKSIEKEVLKQRGKTQRNMKASVMRNDNNKMSAGKRMDELEASAGKNLRRAKNKLENFEDAEKSTQKRPLKIDFSEMKKSGRKILLVDNLLLEYGQKEEISLEIFSGDRVLISGKNGSGKTTFLKEILSNSKTEKIEWGINIEIGYLPQDFLQEKNINNIFLEYFLEKSEKIESDARKILSRFGFRREETFSKISELSPGMRGRGKIALMLVNNPNVLILDEPTNNLDLEVLEKFEEALKKYKGTIIFVSHDKYFIDKIKPNKILNLKENK